LFGKATSCHVSIAGTQIVPLLNGQSRFLLAAQTLYVPELPARTSAHELRTLEKLAETQRIDNIVTAIQAHQKEVDLNTLIYTHASQVSYHRQPDLYVITFTRVGLCIVLYLILNFSHPFLIACLMRCKPRSEPETGTPDSTRTPPAGVQPKPRHTAAHAKQENSPEELKNKVRSPNIQCRPCNSVVGFCKQREQ
jgi:hypothetical protein